MADDPAQRAEAWALRSAILSLFVVGGLITFFSAITGEAFWGKALAVFILTWPPLTLLAVAFSKVSEAARTRNRPKELRVSPVRVQARRQLLFLASVGFAAIVALVVGVNLMYEGRESGNSALEIAGYAVVFGFGAITVIPLLVLSLFIGAPPMVHLLRSLRGPDKDLYKGMRLALAERLAEADEYLRRFRTQFPADHRGPLWQAFVLLQKYRFEEALLLSDESLALQASAQGYLTRGQALLGLGAAEEALRDFRSARDLHARMPAWPSGYALIELRRLPEALAIFEQEKLKPSVLFIGLGNAHRFLGNRDLAAAAYNRAIQQASADRLLGVLATQGVVACALAELGLTSEAQGSALQILKRKPDDINARYALARVALTQTDLGTVERMLREIIAVYPRQGVMALTDPDFTPLLTERRFRELLAWALGAQSQVLKRVRQRPTATNGEN
jgi:tetratricopeptide (TPR) repeat protein